VTGAATLDGQSLKSFGQGADGNFLYSVESGPLAGTTISIADGVTDAEISVGRSIATQMRDYLDDVLSSGSTLDMSTKEYKSDFDENTEMLEALDEKYDMLYDRYLSRFTAMEQVVAQLNSTGDYLTNLVDAWNSDN
jgi:flagellar hook-associated protein 2